MIVEELLTLLLALLLVLQIRIPIPDAFVRLQIKESTIASDVTSWVIHFEPHHADP